MLPLAHEATRQRIDQQSGASLLLFVIGIFLVAATISAIKLLIPAKRGAIQMEATTTSFEAIQNAVVAYVATNGHMPCPANPAAANDGASYPAPPNANCIYPSGVVPWATLGISPDAALDGWYRRISYRVLDGATGLTQEGGASMTNCDTLYPYGGSLPALPADGLCPVTHVNTAEQFLNAKGLVVSDFTALKTGVAYALISHGESGYGAYLPGGLRVQMPPAGDELINTGAASPFVKKAHSDPGVDPSVAAHFDDIVAWVSISDLIKKSGRNGRDWQDSGITVQITPETTTNMNVAGPGHFNAAGTPGAIATADTIPDAGSTIDTLVFVGIGEGAACIWWPTSFKVYNAPSRYAIRLYLEYSTTTGSGEFGGFTAGFLPKAPTDALAVSGTPLTAMCGDISTSSSIGWSNGATSLGNLPTPRFAAETDMSQDGASNDPAHNHLAVDFSDVTHGTTATACSLFPDAYHVTGANNDCYTGPSNTWLRDGLSNFHRMRIEVYPRDPACSGGTAPRLKAWILPQSLCPSDSAATICADAKNLLTTFSPTAPLPAGAVAIESCIPAPATSTDLDDLYFGMTASSRLGASGSLQYIRNLGAAAFLMP